MSQVQGTKPLLGMEKRPFVGLVGLVFFVAGTYIFVHLSLPNIMLSLKGVSSQGVVQRLVESELVPTAAEFSESKYHVYYSFSIPNEEFIKGHTQLSESSWASLQPGQTVRVLYLSNNPGKNRLADYPQWWVIYLIMIIFPPLFGGIGLFLLLYVLRPEVFERIKAFVHLFLKDPSLSAKDISGERLFEHLKNIGIDAEIIIDIDDYLVEVTWLKPDYSFSIRLKGLNIDIIQIKHYSSGFEYGSYVGYRIDYIVRGFERNKWHLEKKLKRLGDSGLFKLSLFGKTFCVSPDKENRFIRLYVFNPLLGGETIVVEEGGKRVKYRYLKNAELPSRETLKAYDKIARSVRKIIENG